MNVLFVQLPAPDPNKLNIAAFVPYRAGCIAAYAEATGAIKRDEWAFLNDLTATYGGDAAVVTEAASREPDIVAFDLDGPTLDRSVWIARKLRARLPKTVFAAFGPEAVRLAPVFKASVFDAIIEGEAELAFVQLLADVAGRSVKPYYRADRPIDLTATPDPYLAGTLPIRTDRVVVVEASRGRRNQRAYERSSGPFRTRAPETPASVLRLATKSGAVEAFIVDRDPGGLPDLAAFFRTIAGANDQGMPIGITLSPELVTDDIARYMMDASIVTVNAPLHAIRPDTLAAVGGSLDREGFERGTQNLAALGTRVRPRLLVGLPGEDFEAVVESYDFLGMTGLGQDTRVDPLSVRPGSRLFERPTDFGIKEFLQRPPYYVLETDHLAEGDIVDALGTFEENFDVAWAEPIAPRFVPELGGYTCFVDARNSSAIDRLTLAPERLADSVTILLDAGDVERCSRVARAATDMRRENPYTLYQFILYSNTGIPSENLVARLTTAFLEPDHYYELCHSHSLDPQQSFQTRLFFATKSTTLALEAMDRAQDLETALILDPAEGLETFHLIEKIFETLPFVFVDRDRTPFELLYRVMMAYRDFPDLVVETSLELFSSSRTTPL